MERDVADRDEYERLLRNVRLGHAMINAELVRLGYTYSYFLPPNIRYKELFIRLEGEGRE